MKLIQRYLNEWAIWSIGNYMKSKRIFIIYVLKIIEMIITCRRNKKIRMKRESAD